MFKVKKFDVKDCLGREYFKHAQTYPKSLTKRIYKEGFEIWDLCLFMNIKTKYFNKYNLSYMSMLQFYQNMFISTYDIRQYKMFYLNIIM